MRMINRGISKGAFISTSSQPKSVAVADDSAVFIPEVSSVEVIKSNQKIYELKTSFGPSSVAASKSLVAVGGDVGVS
jgi:WD repeat-containing protein 1 (actin-interacting protein 1)